MRHLDELPSWVLSQASARVHQLLQSALAAAGFTGFEYRLLAGLDGVDSLSQADLGRRAALDRHDVTVTVRKLEDRELLTRSPDPEHGRRVLVALSPAGREALDALVAVVDAVQVEAFGALSDAEREQLLRMLRTVASASSRSESHSAPRASLD